MTERVWKKAFQTLLESEGGYVNDKRDSGGETKYGISKRAYPDVDIEALTLWQAEEIYHKDYWLRCKCDLLPDYLSIAVFDYAVNSGVSKAAKSLQKVLGVTADGKIGNQTIGAANTQPPHKVLDAYLEERLNFMMSLKGWKYYGNGWGKRIDRIKRVCEALI